MASCIVMKCCRGTLPAWDQDVTFPDRHVIVLEGEVFVMGDNRENSIDSRHFGCIDIQSQIIGKVIWKLF